jgi:hypothetical protein
MIILARRRISGDSFEFINPNMYFSFKSLTNLARRRDTHPQIGLTLCFSAELPTALETNYR